MIPTSRLSSFLLFLAFLPVVAWGQSVSKPAAKTAAKTTVAPASNKSSGTKTDPKKSVAAPAVKAKDSGKANAVKPVKEAAEPKEKEMTPAQRAQAQKAAKAEKVKRPRILRDADDYYNAKEYFKAITLYKKGFSKAKARPDKAEVAFRLGECYRWTRRYKEANAQYVRAVKIGYKDPSVLLIMADMHKALDEYEEALIAYQDFTKQMPEDPRGPKGAQSCKDALDWKKALTRYQVGNLGSVNSRFHEVGLSFSGKPDTYEELLFTSFREGGLTKRQDGWTGEFFADLYTAQRQAPAGAPKAKRGAKTKPDPKAAKDQVFSTPVLMPEPLNSADHEGAAAYDSRRRTLYFTRCMDVKRAQLGCAIYETKRMGVAWSAPEPIVFTSDSSKSVGHPSISSDDQMLYFAGDLDGNKGGKDLWVAKYDKRKKKWGTPINLGGLVNTSGDELFPYVHDDGYLYFASDGLPGMGGMDLFRVELGADGLPNGEPENLRFPINSKNDDINLVLRPGGLQDGYFISNRDGGKGGYDVWTFYEVPLTYKIQGNVVSAKTGRPIAAANVKIIGSDGFTHSIVTSKEGTFVYESDKLSGDVTYTFSLEKKKFLNAAGSTNTVALSLDKYAYQDDKNTYLHTMSFVGKMDPIEVPIVLPNVFFDLAKWELRPESKAALDSVYKILLANPNIAIELRSHTDFRDTDEKNQVLSQNRAQSCVDYLISKGIKADRLGALGMGEKEPFSIPDVYKGYGAVDFPAGTALSERFIKTLPAPKQEVAHQINRRTDFKVVRDDYAPPYDPAQEMDAASLAAEEAKKVKVAPKGEFYTVGDKDNFTTICRNTSLTITDLKKLNGGLRGVRVFPGMKLKVTLGGDYAEFDASNRLVQYEETWGSIAKALELKEKELKALNPDIDDDLLPGMYIRVK